MDNYTYYKEQIGDIMKRCGSNIAFDEEAGVVASCSDIDCRKCKFRSLNATKGLNNVIECNRNFVAWLNQEHKVQPKLNPNEMAFLKTIDENCWIARGRMLRDIYIYKHKPYKGIGIWRSDTGNESRIWAEIYTNCNFDFIKWEDEEPWQVKDLLKLEVEK